MPNEVRKGFLREVSERYGPLRKLGKGQSLYELNDSRVKLYLRYSKIHGKGQAFYGLRESDLRELEGRASVICFLWEGQREPLLVPYSDYEDVFRTVKPAQDGQFKAQIYFEDDGFELYLAQAGRFSVEGNRGWGNLAKLIDGQGFRAPMDLSHCQVQTLLGAIGIIKGHDVWIPTYDQANLDWSLTKPFVCRPVPPYGYQSIAHIIQEVDVVWLGKGSSDLKALFEVEHSTTIYSGLLRFNDVNLVAPQLRPTFSIVANDLRRNLFVK